MAYTVPLPVKIFIRNDVSVVWNEEEGEFGSGFHI